MMDSITRLIAVELSAQIKAYRAKYDADVDEWYRSGDGRSPNWRTELSPDGTDVRQVNMGGKGYRYPACIHGKSYWTDYDNICGPCDDGYGVYDLALGEAHGIAREYDERTAILAPLLAHKHDLLADTCKDLAEWAFAPLDPILRGHTQRNDDRSVRMAGWRSQFDAT